MIKIYTPQQLIRWAGLLFCVGLIGCTQILPILVDNAPCTADIECPNEQLCVLGGCVLHEQPPSTTLAFEIRPPEDSGFQNQQIVSFEPATQDRFSLTLQKSVEMKGLLQKHDGTALNARIVATPTTGIPGRSLVVITTSDAQGYFHFNLIDGLSYRWSIFPNDTSFAPVFLTEVRAEAQDDWGEPIIIANPDALRVITGRLTANFEPTSQATPVTGLQVRLFSGDKMVSSAAQTDDEGRFEIRVTDGNFEEVELEIWPAEDNSLWPTLRINDFQLDDSIELGDIDLGTWPQNQEILIRVVNEDGQPVPSAKIYAMGDMGKGHIKLLEATDEEGLLVTTWPNNAYDIAIVAPSTALAGFSVQSQIIFSEIDNVLVVTLPLRQPIEGIVWSPSGPPVAGTILRFERLGNVEGNNLRTIEKTIWSFEALTDTDGRYGLVLDPGLYATTVTPPAGTTLPVLTQKIQVLPSTNELDFVFPDPFFITGKIILPTDESPLQNTVIRAFTPVINNSENDNAVEYQWLGDGLSDKSGAFDIIVHDPNSQ
jgi:hypothetical protein